MLTAKTILLLMLQNNQRGITTLDIDTEQAYCMALNIYHEARGEHVSGQFAVAHTTLNRVKDERFPNNVCEVVKQSKFMREDFPELPAINQCQFSWYCDGKPDKVYLVSTHTGRTNNVNVESFTLASQIALMSLAGHSADNTGGATFYYNYKKHRSSFSFFNNIIFYQG